MRTICPVFCLLALFTIGLVAGCSKKEAPTAAERSAAKVEKAPVITAPVGTAPEKDRETLEERRNRAQEIYALSRSGTPEDMTRLEEIIKGSFKPYEKSMAIRAIGDKRREGLVETLKSLAAEGDLEIRSEAVIRLYRWGEEDFAKPYLMELPAMGIAVRRTFLMGYANGKYQYDDGAKEILQKAVGSEHSHVRLDAALGLLHLGEKEQSIPVFRKALEPKSSVLIKRTAVNFLAMAKDIPEARALLEGAVKDEDPAVSERVKGILGIEEDDVEE